MLADDFSIAEQPEQLEAHCRPGPGCQRKIHCEAMASSAFGAQLGSDLSLSVVHLAASAAATRGHTYTSLLNLRGV